MRENPNYIQHQKLSFAQFMAEIPNFMVLTVSAFLTGSLIVWMDFIDSLGNILRTGTVALLSGRLRKDLRYEYNYGDAKLEDIAVLFCDSIVLCGLMIAAALSVHELIEPERPSELLLLVVGLKVINVTIDLIFLRGQYKLRKNDIGMLTRSMLQPSECFCLMRWSLVPFFLYGHSKAIRGHGISPRSSVF